MSEDRASEPEIAASFSSFASQLWEDEELRHAIAERYEVRATNFWLFCADLKQKALDPKRWEDPDYWGEFKQDIKDPFKGGKRHIRDDRHGKPDKFWRWAEDAKKDEMSRRTGQPIPHDDVERWYKEWLDKGKPDGWGRQMSKPLD